MESENTHGTPSGESPGTRVPAGTAGTGTGLKAAGTGPPGRFVVFRSLHVIEVFYVEAGDANAARERVLPARRDASGLEGPSRVAHVGPEKHVVKPVRRFPADAYVYAHGGERRVRDW